jgi:hypothetical protein
MNEDEFDIDEEFNSEFNFDPYAEDEMLYDDEYDDSEVFTDPDVLAMSGFVEYNEDLY